MIYNIKNNNYKNFSITKENILPTRSYFVPFSNKLICENSDHFNDRKTSDRVSLLNGKWDFVFYENGLSIPKVIDTEKLKYKKINVPSTWQNEGYDKPSYEKGNYKSYLYPPKIPTNISLGFYTRSDRKILNNKNIYNSAGIYRRIIDIKRLDKTYILTFFGVSSCFELYANGEYVGYSEGSHNVCEFDISDFMKVGSNEILVLVNKWCNSSYLDNMDMFCSSGIFRDVLLTTNNRTYIYDFSYKLLPINNKGKYHIKLSTMVNNYEGFQLRISLKDGNVTKYENTLKIGNKIIQDTIEDNFVEYSPENPKLYTLYLSLIKNGIVIECVYKNIGFKRISIEKDVFYYNGKAIKIKGINYCPTSKKKSLYISDEQMEKDIILMKEYNINAIKFSSYPADPLLYDICDKYGMYVIAEADINCCDNKFAAKWKEKIALHSKRWENYYLDRIMNMVETLKNQTSIVMWSFGRNNKNNKIQAKAYEKIKEISMLPLLYQKENKKAKEGFDIFDIKNINYEEFKEFITTNNSTKKSLVKPIFLSEFAYCYGLGPGMVEEYYDIFNTSDMFLGGCIWQFCDRAIEKDEEESVFLNENNCLYSTGIFSVDRVPYSGAKYMKYIYKPIIARLIDNNTIEFFNTNFFSSSENIAIFCSIIVDGKTISRTEIKATIKPRETRKYDIFLGHIDDDMFLNIKYINKNSGKEVAMQQICINENMSYIDIEDGNNISIKDYKDLLTVYFDNGLFRMDKRTGSILNYIINGKDFLNADSSRKGSNCFSTNILRPHLGENKFKEDIDLISVIQRDFSYQIKEKENGKSKSVEIIVNNAYFINDKESYVAQDMFIINANGKLDIYTTLHPRKKKLKNLQCFGKIIKLSKEFSNVIYYGREDESYPDMKNYTPISLNNKVIEDFENQYILPQECGNRSDTRYAIFSNEKGQGLMLLALKTPFNMNIKFYPKWKIDKSKNKNELGESNGIYVHIDNEISGISENSNYYKIENKDSYIFGFSAVPFTSVDKSKIY